MKTKLFTLFLTILVGSSSLAHDFIVNDIYYNKLTNNTVEVTYKGSSGGYSDEYSGDIVIPETVTYNGITYSVTSIGEEAFYTCSYLNSVTIPNSVTSIGKSAFWYCWSLTSVTIPNGVTSIESETFRYCESITTINLPNNITSIGDAAFLGCWRLDSIAIPNSVTSIGDHAFCGCTSLTSITIPRSVTAIGSKTFDDCSSLMIITFKGDTPPSSCGIDISRTNKPVCYVPCGASEAYILKFVGYIAHFIEQSANSIVLQSSNDTYGRAQVVSRPDCNNAVITAIPNEGYIFVKWSDGNTETTRYIDVTDDINLVAYFAKKGYTIHINQDCTSRIE